MKPRIGILALQGCVEPHRLHLEAAGAEVVEIRHERDFKGLQGLIAPGGESTTMLRLLRVFHMEDAFRQSASTIPFWGICAGAILAAREVRHPAQKSFGIVHCTIARNAYGRQLDSFNAEILGTEVAFIRAPLIESVGPEVEVLARNEGQPVWIRQGRAQLTSFHPELSEQRPSPFHKAFVESALHFRPEI